jgi:hypothetical protein
MRTQSVTWNSRSWRARWPLRWFYRHRYWSRLRWPVRTLAWLVTASLVSIAGWQYVVLGPVAFEAVFLASVLADERRVRGLPGPVALAENSPRLAAIRAEIRRQAALPRVPSPGGWSPPAGVRPAWSWTPPPGLEPRLDRAPVWVRIWYGTPLADRYAHAWLWHHGGWDVVPPESWGTGSASGQ